MITDYSNYPFMIRDWSYKNVKNEWSMYKFLS